MAMLMKTISACGLQSEMAKNPMKYNRGWKNGMLSCQLRFIPGKVGAVGWCVVLGDQN